MTVKTKKIVMCDTMIWYDLYEGVEVLDRTNYEYHGSLSNVIDFLSSDKMKNEIEEKEKLKNAIRTMDTKADRIMLADPTTVGSSNWFNIDLNRNELEEMRKVLLELLKFASGRNKFTNWSYYLRFNFL